jgi:hypothetical protein
MDGIEAPGLEEAFEALERGAPSVSPRARVWLELLAALPAGLEPIEPPARVREAVMAAARAGDGGEPGTVRAGSAAAAGRSRRSLPSWALRVAAILAVALVGIAALQSSRISSQHGRIERQAAEIVRLQEELARAEAALDRPPAWMASSGTELCALSPRRAAEADPPPAASKGWLFVRHDHQHWYVAVEGLAAAPDGHVYELWFVVEGELVSGGTFRPDAAGRATLTSETMPNPVSGIAITLEPDNGDSVPSEMMVLYGDEVMLIL